MSEISLYRIDGVLWGGALNPQAYCPKHRLELDPYTYDEVGPYKYDHLRCEECPEDYIIPRDIDDEQTYVKRKLRARQLNQTRVINIDDESVPLAETKLKNGKYFVTALLTQSKLGHRLVVYAGEKGKKDKAQIFIEPEIKRLAFDQNNIHPTKIFAKLEAIFKDGTKHSIQ